MKTGLKLLAINNSSAVHLWRIARPIHELQKHTDWQIDEQPTLIQGIDTYKDYPEFTEEEFAAAAEHLGQYDIVWSSYSADISAYLLMKVVHDKYGTKFVIDVDDDLFHVEPDNPIWRKVTAEQMQQLQTMIADVSYISTTTEVLADVLRARREQDIYSVTVLPNYMPDDYMHAPIDNGKWVQVGYFGGASHFKDLNDTKVTQAVKRLMRKYKNVQFTTVNVPVKENLPVKRHHYLDGKSSTAWVTDLFPTLNFDIAVIPLRDNIFNQSSSNIKWLESTRMGAATVCSNVGPYADLPDDVTIKVENHYFDWYEALDKLIQDVAYRKQLVTNAQKQLATMRLEDHWQEYKQYFEDIKAQK